MLSRFLSLPQHPPETFFLWGPRQTGKSTLLRASYPDAYWVDLLHTDRWAQLAARPALLREELLARPRGQFVVIDEIQKVPELLDEVHWLMENHRNGFALSGSSARKVRRGHANLLGGRALRFELFGLVSAELGPDFDLLRLLNVGYLPAHVLGGTPKKLRSYVQDYLKEEVMSEGLVRRLSPFSSFLTSAALSDTEIVNAANVARECGVSAPTAREYFQILVDTLLARWLPAYTKRPKRRVVQAPKFYFADVGVVNVLARRGSIALGSELGGKAFENWVFHELAAYVEYAGADVELAYWRLASGIEVDFVVPEAQVAIEAKCTERVHRNHLTGLRQLAVDQPWAHHRYVVCREPRIRKTEDGILILPFQIFAQKLWSGELFAKPAGAG